ncbi:SbmA/BacA-like family protein [Cryptosporidium muris RN66]|uniref:SbmA/BacA-like family protein n=1 Tax=Cryptosporidium muris (strain RN66) TaxID=441375 RepID=B6AF79_CRYMR|nr:SbmA/BacA-like family protein [Cryptosporidium muris RN66]EEA06870.1 SbmA/BacA-like family protein [Cryptosporidium muris RN66]|eukprot:XP_002141219.1 SbmA/BacA-like family protein [Cryptosporidium muris RN66]
MIAAYLWNRKYFLRAYLLFFSSLLLMWYESSTRISMSIFVAEYNQILSDCVTARIKCEVYETTMVVIKGIVPIALSLAVCYSINSYVVNVFIFYWRQALSEYYLSSWPLVRGIEGASQRIQEDTKAWAKLCQATITDLIQNLMMGIQILPKLIELASSVPEIFIFGKVKYAALYPPTLLFLAQFLVILLTSVKLPYLHYENQKIEAALRKELVLAEDNNNSIDNNLIKSITSDLQRNYYATFRWNFPFAFGNLACREAMIFIGSIFLWPSFFSGTMTISDYYSLDLYMMQLLNVLQVIQRRWREFTEIMAIYRRLSDFENKIIANKNSNVDNMEKIGLLDVNLE